METVSIGESDWYCVDCFSSFGTIIVVPIQHVCNELCVLLRDPHRSPVDTQADRYNSLPPHLCTGGPHILYFFDTFL